MTPIPPVIFVPGITASELRDEYPLDPERVWSVLRHDYLRIALHPDDTRYEAKEPARVIADRVFRLVYGEFIEELRHNLSPKADLPTPVYAFPYDWRQPLALTAAQLTAFIDEIIQRTRLLPHYHKAGYGEDGRVNLVGHSMGGLVIAEYLARHGNKHRAAKVATLGTPFRGSFEAVLKVATGTADIGEGRSSSRDREVARVTPALYHLLPQFEGAVSAAEGLKADLFDPAAWQPAVVQSVREYIRLYGLDRGNLQSRAEALFAQMLKTAAEHRARVEKLQVAAVGLQPEDWLAIVGLGEETRVHLRIASDRGKPWFDLTSQDRKNEWTVKDWPGKVNTGDGTVPYLGAKPPFLPANQLVCVADDDFGYWELKDRLLEGVAAGLHGSLPLMNLVQRLVVSHFLGTPFGEVWGRRAPDTADKPWQPPIKGLREKTS